MTEFEKQLHSMFDHIWECEIDHPVFQDTVGELMSAVIQCYNNLPSAQPKSYEDAVSREKVFEYFVSLWECIGTIMDRDEWEDVCKTTANELPSAQPSFSQRHENDHIAEVSKMDCIYCHEDSDGYVTPLEKNSHAFIRFGMDGWELDLKANGWHGSARIRYCPMCGRRLEHG